MIASDSIVGLGVGGIFAVMVIKEVFAFVKGRNGTSETQVENRARQMALEAAVLKLAENIELLPGLFKEIHRDMVEMRKSNDETHLQIVETLKACLKQV